MENTKPIPNHTGYHVTTDGRIYSAKLRPGWCTPQDDSRGLGYKHYWLHNGKKKYRLYAHRAVALTYLPNPENKPHINHIDNDPSNNSLDNLEWCTQKENMHHAFRQGRMPVHLGESNGNAKLTREKVIKLRQLHKAGVSYLNIMHIFHISKPTIYQIISHRTWKNI